MTWLPNIWGLALTLGLGIRQSWASCHNTNSWRNMKHRQNQSLLGTYCLLYQHTIATNNIVTARSIFSFDMKCVRETDFRQYLDFLNAPPQLDTFHTKNGVCQRWLFCWREPFSALTCRARIFSIQVSLSFAHIYLIIVQQSFLHQRTKTHCY